MGSKGSNGPEQSLSEVEKKEVKGEVLESLEFKF